MILHKDGVNIFGFFLLSFVCLCVRYFSFNITLNGKAMPIRTTRGSLPKILTAMNLLELSKRPIAKKKRKKSVDRAKTAKKMEKNQIVKKIPKNHHLLKKSGKKCHRLMQPVSMIPVKM